MSAFGRDRWEAIWYALRTAEPPGLRARLVACWDEPHRAYHTLQHLQECFDRLDEAVAAAERPAEIELALWFHDAIYDTRAPDSEERSARWARQSLVEAGVAVEAARRVEALVLATKHSGIPDDPDTRILIDVDLSILGAGPDRYAEYERQVRKEYSWVPEDGFRAARRRILSSFLTRPRIYGTEWFHDRLETRARDNLESALRSLEAAENPI
jgi:predicted metal-dependent HD superfamily phosphohydrolase